MMDEALANQVNHTLQHADLHINLNINCLLAPPPPPLLCLCVLSFAYSSLSSFFKI